MQRVAVTGMDILTSLGGDLAAVWKNLVDGRNGITRIKTFDPSEYQCKVAAHADSPVEDTELAAFPIDHCRRMVQLFLNVARGAYADSGLERAGVEPRRVGVSVGTSVNYFQMGLLRRLYPFRKNGGPQLDLQRVSAEDRPPASSFFLRSGDLTAAVAAKRLQLAGPNVSVDTACAASAHAIGAAFRLVQQGKATAMLAGGSSAFTKALGILAFELLGALSRNPDPERASRPFDRDRDGFVMGEGAGAVMLESMDHARRRGARIYGEVVGFGSTTNAHNLTDPSPDGVCEAEAMRLALHEGKMAPDSVQYVAAHGTSTAKNDETETAAVKRVFGAHARRLMISSNKAQIGHTISAAGACNFIFALKAMNDGCVPPTMHYEKPDPVCDLDYVPNEARSARVDRAIVNAFAFGGQNASIAIQRV